MTRDVLSEPRLLSALDEAIERHQGIAYRAARRRVLRESLIFLPAFLLALGFAWVLGNAHGITEGKRQATLEARR